MTDHRIIPFNRIGVYIAGPGLIMWVILSEICLAERAEQVNVSPPWDLQSDTWVATDALGRQLPGQAQCGPVRPDRFVGIFYWTWHTHHSAQGPFDNTRIIAEHPDAPQWGPVGAPHHWGEPELGYYVSTDPYVLFKHASMLSDAGVDVVIFDTTNPPFTFKASYMALCRTYRAMRAQGNRTPQIAFLCPFGDPTVTVKTLYHDLYAPGLFKALWFQWHGKPLIMADPAPIKDPAIHAFFTFRKPIASYFTGPSGPNQWGWLEVYPQHAFYDASGRCEQVCVGIAQNAVGQELSAMSHKDGARGRSWQKGARQTGPKAGYLGLNFAEQWERALSLDPEFVFITGWNEWVAGRFTRWYKYTGQDSIYPDALFVDEYNHEYSRDIEPMRAGHTDSYYYQMIAYIRRFKGMHARVQQQGPGQIGVDGDFSDWTDIQPEFRDTIGDTLHRDHRGYGNTHYRNSSGRNDIILCKLAHDAESLYCYVRTAAPLTSPTGPNWMLLFLDTDLNARTGWQGYDFLVNHPVLGPAETTLKRSVKGWEWQSVCQLPLRVQGCELELQIPLRALNLSPRAVRLDFHWADNLQAPNDIIQFSISGDSAPNRRFNYRYE